MDDLNKIKELLEEKYNAVIFTNLEKYLNENKILFLFQINSGLCMFH